MSDNSTISKILASFHPRSLPLMARLSYKRELFSWSLLPLMLSGLHGGTIAIFLKKTFDGVAGVSNDQLAFAVGIVAASKAIGHLTSFVWASVSRGKRKIQFMFVLQLLTAGIVALIALAPRTATGLWTVTGLCIVAWSIWSGVVTLRAGVWRANYRVGYRTRVAGRISTIDALIVAAAGVVIGYSLDTDPMTYRIMFPLLAIVGVFGAIFYRRIPFRRESQHLANERANHSTQGPSLSPMVIARVLKRDRWYRGYMACMFTMGFGNLMLHPILAIALTDQFDVGYQTGIAIMTVIPLVCMTFAIPFWSRRLERMHVIEFRAVHVWCFVAVSLLVLLGVGLHQIAFLYLAAVVTGFGWGGGVLAWNLGHQHFAPPHRDAEYMGIHITLTGIRGVIGPLLGVQLYILLSKFGYETGALLICFSICLAMNIMGAIGFVLLARKLAKHVRESTLNEPANIEEPVVSDKKRSLIESVH
jgi:hypothetical protein